MPVSALLGCALAAVALHLAVQRATKNAWQFEYEKSWEEHALILAILKMHPVPLLIIMAAVGVTVGLVAHKGLSRLAQIEWFKKMAGEEDEVAGHFLGVVGAIYAVVIAFIVATAWDSYNHARDVALREQHDVVMLFRVVGAHSDTINRKLIQGDIRKYAADLAVEWRAMDDDQTFCYRKTDLTNCLSLDDNRDVWNIGKAIVGLSASNEKDQAIYQKSIDLFDDFTLARTERRKHYLDRVILGLWWSFIVGAIVVLVLSYMVGKPVPKSHRVRTSAICAMIAVMVTLVVIFDHPFTGWEAARFDDEQWCSAIRYFDAEPHGNRSNVSPTTRGSVYGLCPT